MKNKVFVIGVRGHVTDKEESRLDSGLVIDQIQLCGLIVLLQNSAVGNVTVLRSRDFRKS